MDYRVIVSPEKGFWTDQGWQPHLSEAVTVPSHASIVLSFRDDNVSLIRRKDIQIMTRHSFLLFLVKIYLKRVKSGDLNELHQNIAGVRVTHEKESFVINDKALSSQEAEDELHRLCWCLRPSSIELERWGKQFLHYMVKAGADDTIYVISLSSPAQVEKLKPPHTGN